MKTEDTPVINFITETDDPPPPDTSLDDFVFCHATAKRKKDYLARLGAIPNCCPICLKADFDTFIEFTPKDHYLYRPSTPDRCKFYLLACHSTGDCIPKIMSNEFVEGLRAQILDAKYGPPQGDA